jgi:hypothetical protein
LFSRKLNQELWDETSVIAEPVEGLRTRLNERLHTQDTLLADVLRLKYSELKTSNRFFNEEKLCLGSDLLSGASVAKVFRGSYYHGFVSNDLVTSVIWERDNRDALLYEGSRQPIFVVSSEKARYELGLIEDSGLSNHVGTSVLLITSDGYIPVWRQTKGERHIDKDITTASGSCDWRDWNTLPNTSNSLTEAVRRTMERELREECGLVQPHLLEMPIAIRLLGYFRWVSLGGKPQFVGIARAPVLLDELNPEKYELDRGRKYHVLNVPELQNQIDEYLKSEAKECSLPLWVTLACLRDRCAKEPEGLAAFLWPNAASPA